MASWDFLGRETPAACSIRSILNSAIGWLLARDSNLPMTFVYFDTPEPLIEQAAGIPSQFLKKWFSRDQKRIYYRYHG